MFSSFSVTAWVGRILDPYIEEIGGPYVSCVWNSYKAVSTLSRHLLMSFQTSTGTHVPNILIIHTS